MSIKTRQVHAAESAGSVVSVVSAESAEASGLVAEYVARTERLFSRLHAPHAPRPLPADYRLAYERPDNLALELEKSILYENVDSIDANALKSLDSHGEDSLWNGKPQQYFESMNYAERPETDDDVADGEEYDSDSLAP